MPASSKPLLVARAHRCQTARPFACPNAGGDTVAIWVLTRRASFSLANVNVAKDQATLRAEALSLAKLVAKKLK